MRRLMFAVTVVAIAFGASPVWAQKKAPSSSISKSFSFSTSSHRGRLGVQVMSMTAQLRTFFGVRKGKGVLVAEVKDGTPGKRAGLRAGDVLLSVDGDEVSSVWDVRKALSDRNKGEQVEIQIVRGKARRKVSAQLDTDPSSGMFGGLRGLKSGKGQSKSFRFDFDLDDLDALNGKLKDGLTSPKSGVTKRQRQRIDRLEKRMRALEKKLGASKGGSAAPKAAPGKKRLPPKIRVPKKPAPKSPALKKPALKSPFTKI